MNPYALTLIKKNYIYITYKKSNYLFALDTTINETNSLNYPILTWKQSSACKQPIILIESTVSSPLLAPWNMKARIGSVIDKGVTWRGCSGQTPFILATRHPAEFTRVTEFVVVFTDGVEVMWWATTGPILMYFQPEDCLWNSIRVELYMCKIVN